MRLRRTRRTLPGFSLTLGITLGYLGVIVLLPLAALLWRAAGLSAAEFLAAVSSPRALATYRVTVTAALQAVAFNGVVGLLFAWVLARYDFPGRRLLDAVMDIPFALPTAVAGVALSAALSATGWFGPLLAALGWTVVNAQAGIAVAMAFTSLPFVVRTVQPVLEDLDADAEDAAGLLGAGRWHVIRHVIAPVVAPAVLAGMTLAFARCLGEFGAIIFIAGNRPMKTEITSLLIYIRLEEYNYPAATAIAVVILLSALVVMLVANAIQAWQHRYLDTEGA